MKSMKKQILWILIASLFILWGCKSDFNDSYKTYRASKFQSKHPTWDDETVMKLAKRKIEPGMTAEMVREAFGKPDSIEKEGDVEKWGYAYYEMEGYGKSPMKTYAYFVYIQEFIVIKTTGSPNVLEQYNKP